MQLAFSFSFIYLLRIFSPLVLLVLALSQSRLLEEKRPGSWRLKRDDFSNFLLEMDTAVKRGELVFGAKKHIFMSTSEQFYDDVKTAAALLCGAAHRLS